MRKLVSFILVVIFVVSINVALSKETTHDFRNSNWGMTMDEVKISEGERTWYPMDDGSILYVDDVAGIKMMMYFCFDSKGALYKGYLLTEEKHTNKNLYIDDYNNLKKALITKYGEPITDKTKWLDDLLEDNSSDYGLAVSIGDLIYECTWELKRTNVRMVLTGDNYTISHGVVYSDKSYKEEIDTSGL